MKTATTQAPALPVPKLADVRPDDLNDTGRLLDLFDQAIAQKLIGASEAERLKLVASAEKVALRVRAALSAAGYGGDPYPQVRQHDPSWTRER